jgi:4-hydroxy-tetrahydrodipicolinate reductase
MKVALCGLGRAGKEVARTLLDEKNPDLSLSCAFCRPGSNKADLDIGELVHMPPAGIPVKEIDEADEVFAAGETDVVIDFSSHVASLQLMMSCHKYGVGMVVCTTGFDREELEYMYELAQDHSFGLVYAPNVTLGINVLMNLAQNAARKVPEFDFQISERHHRAKVDPVSATAEKIAEAIQRALPEGDRRIIPINAVRAGGYIGYHEVLIVGDNEAITITHESFSRKAFAEGAIRAAKFIKGKTGFYGMRDVLNEPSLA